MKFDLMIIPQIEQHIEKISFYLKHWLVIASVDKQYKIFLIYFG